MVSKFVNQRKRVEILNETYKNDANNTNKETNLIGYFITHWCHLVKETRIECHSSISFKENKEHSIFSFVIPIGNIVWGNSSLQ